MVYGRPSKEACWGLTCLMSRASCKSARECKGSALPAWQECKGSALPAWAPSSRPEHKPSTRYSLLASFNSLLYASFTGLTTCVDLPKP
jgi:hypothetical protein